MNYIDYGIQHQVTLLLNLLCESKQVQSYKGSTVPGPVLRQTACFPPLGIRHHLLDFLCPVLRTLALCCLLKAKSKYVDSCIRTHTVDYKSLHM